MSLWDETSEQLSNVLGNAGLIDEAVPVAVYPAAIYVRTGTSWSLVSVRQVAGVEMVLCVAGVLAEVPVTDRLTAELAARSTANQVGSYLPVIPAGKSTCGVAFKTAVAPYRALLENLQDSTTYARAVVSATLGCADEIREEFLGSFGGTPWDYEHRGYFVNF